MAHVSPEILRERLAEAAARIPVGARYVHYKDPTHTYTVVGFGIQEADETVSVIYKTEYREILTFIRPISSFVEMVRVEGQDTPRFRLLTDTECN